MNDMLNELRALDEERASLEKQAKDYEGLARECRSKMGDAKLKASELRSIVNDAKLLHHSQSTMKAADAARQEAEAAKTEAQVVLSDVKQKSSELSALIAEVKELKESLRPVDAVDAAIDAGLLEDPVRGE